MKKLFMISGMIILALTINAQSIMLQTGNKGIAKSNDQFSGFQVTFSYDKIESVTITETERGTFSALTIEDAFPAGEFGTPQLPIFRKMIQVPVGATPKAVIKNFTTTEYKLEEYGIQKLFPRQPSVRKDQDISDVPFAYDEKAYSRDDFNQSPLAEVNILGSMRGVIIGVLDVNPIQYNPVTHTIMVYNDIEIEVIFENADHKKTEDLFVGTYSPYFKDVYKVLFNEGITRDLYTDHPDLYSTPVRVLVIANRMFEQALQPWLEWKTKKGFYMDVNYTDNIGTTAAAIKTFCHNKYNQGATTGTAPTFIIIVGDTPQVPASQTGTKTAKATDLYYANTSPNPSTNYFPDMYYSRMSAQTVKQLENIIEKTLYYEKYQFADPSYLDNVLLIAGWDGTWNATVGQPTINYASTHYYNPANGYATVSKYLTQNSYNPSNNTYFDNIGFANYTAHCDEEEWSWNYSVGYTISKIPLQSNLNKYYVAVGNCCLAADFGYSGNGGECFGEAMIRAEKKGAVGYIGSSPSSYWHDDLHFAVGAYSGSWSPANPTLANTKDGCYDFIFRDANFNTLCSYVFGGNISVTYAMTNSVYTTDQNPQYYWEAYNVLGDGSLMPYNTQGSDNTVSHLPVIYIGLPTYEVLAVPGSYVAISKDGVLRGTAVVNASGVATVTLDSPIASGGNVDIVVTRNQYKPYMVQVPATAQSGPYIVPASYTVVGNDDKLTYISTNTEIKVKLDNVGVEAASALTVTIACNDPQLTINNANANCGGIAPNGSAIVSFNVTVANNIPDNKIFLVDVTITEPGNSREWLGKLPLTAYAPNFSLEKVLVNGIENGNLVAGTVVAITTVVANKGGADAYNVIGDLEILSPYVTFACEEQTGTGQNLPAGETINIPFTVITTPDMPYGHTANINLLLAAQYGRSYNKDFTVSNSGSGSYCSSGSQDCSDGDMFSSVILYKTSAPSVLLINNQNENCSGNGYADFTNIVFPLEPGQQYTIKVKKGKNTYSNQIRGWFDLNGNNIFDSNEQLISLSFNQAYQEVSQTFTVPQTVEPGTHRFRLVTKFSSTPSACNNSSYGQTHDYSFTIPELYPRPQNVSAVLGYKIITVTWQPPAGGTPTGYNIYRNGSKLNATPLTTTTYTEQNITEGVYAYNVTAIYTGNKESYSQMSNIICNFATQPALCEMPTNLEALVDENTVIITWKKPENIDGVLLGYNIYRGATQLNATPFVGLEYHDEGLEGGTYNYRVAAVYEHCTSGRTDEVTVVILLCEMPIKLKGTVDKTTATITWEKPENINGVLLGYNIYRNATKLNATPFVGLEYHDEGLENGTYHYQVTAVYEHCESELTNEVPVIILLLCEMPTDFKGTADKNTVILTWEKPENIDGILGYNIYRNATKLNATPFVGLEYYDEGLESGTYHYQVAAVYEHCEESELTDEVIVTILSCEMPTDFKGTADESTAILTWKKPENVEGVLLGYNIYRDGDETPLNEELLEELEYRDEELENGEYLYQVSAVYEHCEESEWTEGVVVEIDVTKINDIQTNSYKIFPNPAHDELNITGKIVPNSVRIYNITGQLVYETTTCSTKMNISISTIPAGVYFIKIDSDTGNVTKKIITE